MDGDNMFPSFYFTDPWVSLGHPMAPPKDKIQAPPLVFAVCRMTENPQRHFLAIDIVIDSYKRLRQLN